MLKELPKWIRLYCISYYFKFKNNNKPLHSNSALFNLVVYAKSFEDYKNIYLIHFYEI